MKDRAFRRSQSEKKKKLTKRMLKLQGRSNFDDPTVIGIYAHTPKRCSCWMCGNQRKINGPRISEIRKQGVPFWEGVEDRLD